VIYYKLPQIFSNTPTKDLRILELWISLIAYGFPYFNKYESNATFYLKLYHGNESNEGGLKSYFGITMEINVALICVSNSSKYRHHVYCRTPPTAFEVAAMNLVNKDASFVDQKQIKEKTC